MGRTLPARLALLLLLAAASPAGAGDRFDSSLITRDGRVLEVQLSERFEPGVRQELLAWIGQLAAGLRDVFGHWPLQRWQIVVSPATSGSADDVIPWAQVDRDAITSVTFFVTPGASEEQLLHAWTGYHELAHLLIPYRGWGDAWFPEGLASYYQNILQARAGMIDEQQMWQKLYDGFQRGLADHSAGDQTLSVASDRMRQQGSFMRVYWSGAWYFLAADVRLRLQSGGRMGLDQALAALNRCCADQHLSVPEIVRQLDQLNRVLLFEPLYREVAASARVPAFEELFASLGIDLVDGQVRLQQHGPGASLRRQLAAG